MAYETSYQGDYLVGVDEAGRGPLAGPVIAAAVILDENNPVYGLDDSKKLTEKKREYLYDEIIQKAKSYGIGRAEVSEIDDINILRASLLAMERAVDALTLPGEYILVDGNCLPVLSIPAQAVVGGDALVPEISAASILAKVTRDKEMRELDRVYPEYGLARHKGYPTKAHREALINYGVTPIHRRSFAPVKALLLASV